MNIASILKPTNGSKPKEVIYSHIYETYDYDQFIIMAPNRDLKKPNYNALKHSFKEAYLLSPIIVNENKEIIDGQHRFTVAKELGLPIRYTICPGYTIQEVRQYNKSMQKWVSMDYLKSYTIGGKKDYAELVEFMREFPDFGVQVARKLVSGVFKNSKRQDEGVSINQKDFESGNFKARNIHQAYPLARKIMDFKEYFTGFASPTFVGAIIPILKKKSYDHKRMIHKLNTSGIHLIKCGNQEQYRMLLQKIYNYKVSNEQRADFFNL